MIMRVPGIGVMSARKIVAARKFQRLTFDHLKKIGIALNRARHFIKCQHDHFVHRDLLPTQLKDLILRSGNSKYSPNFSPQIKLF